MKLLIVNGSPRAPRSNSRRYAELFQARWKGEARYAALTAKNHAELAGGCGGLHRPAAGLPPLWPTAFPPLSCAFWSSWRGPGRSTGRVSAC